MRILVVGTSPPPGGSAAARVAAGAAALVAAGHEVEILSPDPRSASHHYRALSGARLGMQLALRARRYDALVLHLEPGLPLSPTTDRASRALALTLLGAALRAFREVTLRLPSPIPLPGGVGGRATRLMWSAATRVVVSNEEDRGRLRSAPGLAPERVDLEAPVGPASAGEQGWRSLDGASDDLRLAVQALVRSRAAVGRRVQEAGAAIGAGRPAAAGDVAGDLFAGAAVPESRLRMGGLAGLAVARLRKGR